MMSVLSDIRPRKLEHVIDLVRAAGVDVSDWANVKGGEKNAATNPKYCYEWSFVEPEKVVVLNIWYSLIEEKDGVIFQNLNSRRRSKKKRNSSQQKRATNFDLALQKAYREKLPLRAIICDGKRQSDDSDEASEVDARSLDPVAWAVVAYDWETGECTIARGIKAISFVDQFTVQENAQLPVERREVSGQAFVRNADVRRKVLLRARGKCEWCGQLGFAMANGNVYLETHHVVPLSEDGPDNEKNVVALCPNHHREAHHGTDKAEMKEKLLKQIG